MTYDIGSTITGLNIVGVAGRMAPVDGMQEQPEVPQPRHGRQAQRRFSNNNFTTTIATDVINLADTMADQDVSFPDVTARYVQFVMPTGSTNFFSDGRGNSDFVLPAEFELYAPEPASLEALGMGGLMLILRRRRSWRSQCV